MTAIELVRKYLYDCIYSSVKIEGLGLTFPQTYEILDKAHVSDADVSDVYFVLNMKRAWQFMIDNLDYQPSVMLARQYNKICGEHLIEGSGDLRQSGVVITGTTYVPPIPFLPDVSSKISEINAIDDVYLRSVEMFMYLAKAQLFVDGNKRVAQLMANHILVSNNAGILKVPDTQTEEFVDVLLKHYEGVSEPLRLYLLDKCIIKTFVVEYVEYDGDEYSIDEICSVLPEAIVKSFASREECAKANVAMYVRMLKGEL